MVFNQINYLFILEKFQSGFRANHIPDTALNKAVSDLRTSTDANKVSVLVLLDITAVFDQIDHNILIEKWVSLSASVLN